MTHSTQSGPGSGHRQNAICNLLRLVAAWLRPHGRGGVREVGPSDRHGPARCTLGFQLALGAALGCLEGQGSTIAKESRQSLRVRVGVQNKRNSGHQQHGLDWAERSPVHRDDLVDLKRFQFLSTAMAYLHGLEINLLQASFELSPALQRYGDCVALRDPRQWVVATRAACGKSTRPNWGHGGAPHQRDTTEEDQRSIQFQLQSDPNLAARDSSTQSERESGHLRRDEVHQLEFRPLCAAVREAKRRKPASGRRSTIRFAASTLNPAARSCASPVHL
jgi:hypothetical protein